MNTSFRCLESRIDKNNTLYGKFSLDSILSGQGNTFGNSLRRSLLSDLSGLAITHFCITSKPGLSYEFATLPGLTESLLDFSLNLKKVVLSGRVIDYQSQKVTPLSSTSTSSNLHLLEYGDSYSTTGATTDAVPDTFGTSKGIASSTPPLPPSSMQAKLVEDAEGVEDFMALPAVAGTSQVKSGQYIAFPSATKSSISTADETATAAFSGGGGFKESGGASKTKHHNSNNSQIEDFVDFTDQKKGSGKTIVVSKMQRSNSEVSTNSTKPNQQGRVADYSNPSQLNICNSCLHTTTNSQILMNLRFAGNQRSTKNQSRQKIPKSLPIAPIGFLKAKGPAVLRASDLILPPGIRCVHPNQYLGTLAADGALSIKFLIAAGKGFIVQDQVLYNSLSRAKLLSEFDTLPTQQVKFDNPMLKTSVASKACTKPMPLLPPATTSVSSSTASVSKKLHTERQTKEKKVIKGINFNIRKDSNLTPRNARQAIRNVDGITAPEVNSNPNDPISFTPGSIYKKFYGINVYKGTKFTAKNTFVNRKQLVFTWMNFAPLPFSFGRQLTPPPIWFKLCKAEKISKQRGVALPSVSATRSAHMNNNSNTTLDAATRSNAKNIVTLKSKISPFTTNNINISWFQNKRSVKNSLDSFYQKLPINLCASYRTQLLLVATRTLTHFFAKNLSPTSLYNLGLLVQSRSKSNATGIQDVNTTIKSMPLPMIMQAKLASKKVVKSSISLTPLPLPPSVAVAVAAPATASVLSSSSCTALSKSNTATDTFGIGGGSSKHGLHDATPPPPPKVAVAVCKDRIKEGMSGSATNVNISRKPLVNDAISNKKQAFTEKQVDFSCNLESTRSSDSAWIEKEKLLTIAYKAQSNKLSPFLFAAISHKKTKNKGFYPLRSYQSKNPRGLSKNCSNLARLASFTENKENRNNQKNLFLPYGGFVNTVNSSKKLSKKQLMWGAEENYYPVLPLDVTFTPVSKVNYQVNVNRNAEKNEETIIIEIWTNGSITPKRALQESCLALAQDFYNLFCNVNEFSSLQSWWKRESFESKITCVSSLPNAFINTRSKIAITDGAKLSQFSPINTFLLPSPLSDKVVKSGCYIAQRAQQTKIYSISNPCARRPTASTTDKTNDLFNPFKSTTNNFSEYKLVALPPKVAVHVSKACIPLNKVYNMMENKKGHGTQKRYENNNCISKTMHSEIKKCMKVKFSENKNLKLKQKVQYLHTFWRLNISDLNLSLKTQLLLKKLDINSVYDLHFFILKKSWSLFFNRQQQNEIVKTYLSFGLNSAFLNYYHTYITILILPYLYY